MKQDKDEYNEELENWPIIGSKVPERRLLPEEITGFLLPAAINAILYVRAKIKELKIRDPKFLDSENDGPYKFLLKTMLTNCRTPEQIANMVNGYVNYCARECRQSEFQSPLLKMVRGMQADGRGLQVIDDSCYGDEKMGIMRQNFGEKKWESLEKYSRNPVLQTVTHGLAPGPIRRYSKEPFYDGAYFIMSDPTMVNHDELDYENTVIERNVPEKKRMTKEKLARLLQFPNLEHFVIQDRNMEGHVIGTNLAIIAEYFCENDDCIYLNEIDSVKISDWLNEKFLKFNPPLELAFYVWARFQQTEFESTAAFIEQYILLHHQKNDPWIFEAAGVDEKAFSKSGEIFDLYTKALKKLQKNPDDPNYQKLLKIIPGREILAIFSSSKTPEYREKAANFMKKLNLPIAHVCPEYTAEKFKQNPGKMFLDIFNEKNIPADKWEAYQGFELLDPIAVKKLSTSLRSWAVSSLQENFIKALDNLSLTDLFVFRNEIAKRVEVKSMRERLEKIIEILIEKAYGESISVSVSTETLSKIVRGEEVDFVEMMPALGILPPELRRAPTPQRMSELAESALLAKHFGDVKGGSEIIKFLLANRQSMHPSELLYPFPDAPNLEIIKRYKESPNLLIFLSISTILMYLGHSPDDILWIIENLIERTEKDSRAELTTVGLEWEQVGGFSGEVIATNKFADLFNILPPGNDNSSNEILSLPTNSAEIQRFLMDTIINPESGYLNTQAMWQAEEVTKAPLSSIHVNLGIPADIPVSEQLIAGYFDPLMTTTWIAHGGDKTQNSSAKGRIKGWRPPSFLDTMRDKNPEIKLEIRNTALERDGSHNQEIEYIFLIASACMQHMREANGGVTTPQGAVMADIYREFQTEVSHLKFSVNEAESARELLIRFAAKIKAELGLEAVNF